VTANYKLLVLERGEPDRNAVSKAMKGYLPGLMRDRVDDVLLGSAELPAAIARSEKEADIRRAQRVLEELGFAVCMVEDSILFGTIQRVAGVWRVVLGLVPEFFKTLVDVLLRRDRRRSRGMDDEGIRRWLPGWIPARVRGLWAIAGPAVLLVAIAAIWVLFTVQVEGTGEGGSLQLPEWTGKTLSSVEPGVIWAGCAFAFGAVLGWTVVPFLAERKAGKKRGFLLALGILGGVMVVVLLAAVAPWRWMTGGGDDGGGGLRTGGGSGGEFSPPPGARSSDLSATPDGPPGSGGDEGSFASFVHGLGGPPSPCDPQLAPFAGLLCELRAMGPPPEGFSPNEPDALADLLTDSFEAMGDDDSAGVPGDDDSASDAIADRGGSDESGGGAPRDARQQQPDEEPAAEIGAGGAAAPAPSNLGGGGRRGGSGGSPDSAAEAQLDEEDRIEEDAQAGSPTRSLFKGDDARKDTSIPDDYTRDGLKSSRDDEAQGELSEESTSSRTRHQATGSVALLCGLVVGGGLGAVRRWRAKR